MLNSTFIIYFKLLLLCVVDFLRYCEYELLHRILDVDIVCSIAGVAIVNALLKSLFCVDFLCLPFNTFVLLVNSINAFKYYKGLNLCDFSLDLDLDFGRDVDFGKDFMFLLPL